MNRALGWALLAGGFVLLLFGVQTANTFNPNISKALNAPPTSQTVWMVAIGMVLIVAGIVLALGSRGTRL